MEGKETDFFFTRLNVYNEAEDLVVKIYAYLTKFPKEEKYALCDQVRRAAVSVPSNIAEGISRTSAKEKVHFLDIAYASLMETWCQMRISYKLDYMKENELKELESSFFRVSKMISALKAKIKNKPKRL